MTPEQAEARLAALRQDASFRTRMLGGDADAKREWNDLIRVVAGMPTSTGTPQVQAQTRLAALMADDDWQARVMLGDATARAELSNLHAILAENDQ